MSQFFDSQSFSIVGTIQPIRVLGNRYGYRLLLTFTGAYRTKLRLYVAVARLSKLLDRGHTGKSVSIASLGVSRQKGYIYGTVTPTYLERLGHLLTLL